MTVMLPAVRLHRGPLVSKHDAERDQVWGWKNLTLGSLRLQTGQNNKTRLESADVRASLGMEPRYRHGLNGAEPEPACRYSSDCLRTCITLGPSALLAVSSGVSSQESSAIAFL